MKFKFLAFAFSLLFSIGLRAETGYDLWLRYKAISDVSLQSAYRSHFKTFNFESTTDIANAAKSELLRGIKGLLQTDIKQVASITANGCLVIGTPVNSKVIEGLKLTNQLDKLGSEGFIIITKKVYGKRCTIIAANGEVGALYGVFHLLQLLQQHKNIDQIAIASSPKIQTRMLNHWDNLDGSIERGYAGQSLWKWEELPQKVDIRYTDYARANASIGINATVLNNVNSNPKIMTKEYLAKIKVLADIFRPYGLKVFLSVSFSAPITIGGLKTANPLDADVKQWWKDKTDEIYTYIPDFGGFLVKANSEGQPGPQDYGLTHADGANMLADVLQPHNGIVMWRAFVYNSDPTVDRTLQAYNSFKPLDGKFRDNVLVQIKNGPIDFQPREPFSPLFGAMANTSLMMEFQITQEYLGFAKHLVFLSTLYEEVLKSDTFCDGPKSTVANVIEGKYTTGKLTGMAGVANIGDKENWCGHPFAQANWFAFGRQSWDPQTTAESIADEWLRMTFSNADEFVAPIKKMMLESRENVVNYMTPLGLHHIMSYGDHNGPGPWVDDASQPNWKSTYYHNADEKGIGFERSVIGSNAVGQYFAPVRETFNNIETCPENLMLWFHHVSWNYKTKSGQSLWDALCRHYYVGVEAVKLMQLTWNSVESMVDKEQFEKVKDRLAIQYKEAVIWRNSCILYFQTFSNMPVAEGLETPDKTLEYYKGLKLSKD
ncbi:MAG: alpha-glucuronidase family glycosyl hydrolase [Flavobacterium sp.]|nr:alpha-glucuronidase family glycosyl hydrolase [Flavobacterium sp.]